MASHLGSMAMFVLCMDPPRRRLLRSLIFPQSIDVIIPNEENSKWKQETSFTLGSGDAANIALPARPAFQGSTLASHGDRWVVGKPVVPILSSTTNAYFC